MPVSGCPFSRAGIIDPAYRSSVPDFDLDKLARLRGHFTPMKTTSRLLTTLLLLLSVSLAAPNARAVVPPPDGGYPGFNTAEGQNALFSLTTGSANTAVGWFSLFSDTENSFNTATGAGALLFNTADENTAFGTAALLSNTTGFENTANGTLALFSNTTGVQNTAVGYSALSNNTTAGANTSGANTAIGAFALGSTITGGANTAIGYGALFNATGGANIALGDLAGFDVTTGSGNIIIGNRGLAGDADTIRIGRATQTKCYIAGIRDVTTGIGDAIPVVIDSASQLGTVSSSKRFKKEIKPMDNSSETILALKPVSFQYKNDKTNRPQFGLIAEQVAEVNPNLVVRNSDGEIYTVRYDAVNAMLLNEFLKEHKKVEKLEATVADLAATVKEQAAHLQRVSAQLDNSVARVAVTNR
jgi:Chaperone of endosialidase